MSARNITSTPGPDIVAEASEWFIEFRAGEVSEDVSAAFNEWLRSSPQHIQAYLEVAAAWSELPDGKVSDRIDIDGFIERARAVPHNVHSLNTVARTHSARETRPKKARLARRTLFAVAATAAVVAICGALWQAHQGVQTYMTGIGEQHSIRLADGSTVDINARSTLKVRFNDLERRIELTRGQALFRVAREARRPFIVASGNTLIQAIGTEFDVYRKTAGTVVTVIEGRVSVRAPGAPAQKISDVMLSAGQKTVVAPATTRVARPVVADIASATAWTQKKLIFEETSLGEVAEEFNRYNTRTLHVDSRLAGVAISGLYSSTDPASLIAFLRAQPGIVIIERDTKIFIEPRT